MRWPSCPPVCCAPLYAAAARPASGAAPALTLRPAASQCRKNPGGAVKPAPFAYTKARSLDEAAALLAAQADARLLAGGQSLIATLNMRLSAPSLLIDINGLS